MADRTWKATERAIARRLGGRRVGNRGRCAIQGGKGEKIASDVCPKDHAGSLARMAAK